MSKCNILSLDGGGLRAIVQLQMLKEVEKISGKRIHELFDLVVGTSTGGFLAAIVTVSEDDKNPILTLDEIEGLFFKKVTSVFPRKKKKNKLISKVVPQVDILFPEQGLNKMLDATFGYKSLTNCLTPIIISSYDLNKNQAIFFKSRRAFEDREDDVLLFDVCRAASLGANLFPPHYFNYRNLHIVGTDASPFLNNPALTGLSEMLKYHTNNCYGFKDLKMADINILSLGSGTYTGPINQVKKGKIIQLNIPNPNTMLAMQGGSKVVDYQMSELLSKEQYGRFDIRIEIEKYADMANSSSETRNYLIGEVYHQILNDTKENKRFTDFIKRIL